MMWIDLRIERAIMKRNDCKSTELIKHYRNVDKVRKLKKIKENIEKLKN